MTVGRWDDAPRIHPQDANEWRAWLAEHHDDPEPGAWVIEWRRAAGRTPIAYEDLVAVALAYGWIDGMRRTIDDERAEMWFTRRRAGSQWTRLSKERVERLEAAGLMTEAGRAVIDRAKADGTWSMLDESEAGVVPDDLVAALDAAPGAREAFEALTPGRRRHVLTWIAQARRPETRAARIARTAEAAARGEMPIA